MHAATEAARATDMQTDQPKTAEVAEVAGGNTDAGLRLCIAACINCHQQPQRPQLSLADLSAYLYLL